MNIFDHIVKPLWAVLLATLLASCATNETLFAGYENGCRVNMLVESESLSVIDDVGNVYRWEPHIDFELESSSLMGDAKIKLNQNIAILQAYPELIFVVNSYNQGVGSHADQLRLSKKRAFEIKKYMLSQGVMADRVISQPEAKTAQAIVPRKGDQVYELDRRVEFMLLDQFARPIPFRVKSLF